MKRQSKTTSNPAIEMEEVAPVFPRPEYDVHVAYAIDAARSWYGNSLPRRIESSHFITFAAQSWDFVQQIVKNIKVEVDPFMSSAATDGETIFIPGSYFKQAFYDSMTEVEDHAAAAVMCVNGSQIHEAYHVLWSICKLPNYVALDPEADKLFKTHVGFGMLLNLVEDIFIESSGKQRWPMFDMFVQAKNDIFFSELVVWRNMNQLYGGNATQDDLLNALTLLKNPRVRGDERWWPWQEIVDRLLCARNTALTPNQRLSIAIDVWKMMMRATDQNGKPLGEGEISKQQVDRAAATFGAALSPEEAAALISYMIETGKSEGGSGKSKKPPVGMSGAFTITMGSSGIDKLDQILKTVAIHNAYVTSDEADEINTSYQAAIENILMMRGKGKVDLKRIPPVVMVNILEKPLTRSVTRVTPNRDFSKLGLLLRYLRQEKHHVGQPRTFGSQIVKTRLHRIATDQKIMAFGDSKRIKRGKPEVILVIDMSGSMEQKSLINRVAAAAYGAYQSLVLCRIPTAVYGHTSTLQGTRYQPLIYGIAAYEMPFLTKQTTNTRRDAEAFSAIPAVEHSQNFDGIVIEEIAKHFSNRPGSKILVVLSDGQPYGGSDYHAQVAIKHTAQAINDLNRKGISVLSLSLIPEVMEANTSLYGNGNMPAYGGLLERSLQNVVRVIATGAPLTEGK